MNKVALANTKNYSRRLTMTSKPRIGRRPLGFLDWFVLALFSLIATSAYSQLTSGTILGTVTDASGAVLGGAKVIATNLDTGFTRTVTADSAGNYQLPQMPLGRYQIKAEAPNFTSATRGPVELTADQNLRWD